MATRGGGQKVKLNNPERRQAILEALRQGAYLEVAGRRGGVSAATIHRWMDLGRSSVAAVEAAHRRIEEGEKGVKVPPAHEPYHSFYEEVEAARAQSEMRAVTIVQLAGRNDWKAAAWYLERAFPKRWGSKALVEHSGNSDAPVVVEHKAAGAQLSESERMAEVLAALEQAGAITLAPGTVLDGDVEDDAAGG